MEAEQYKTLIENFKLASEQLDEAVTQTEHVAEQIKKLNGGENSLKKELDKFNAAPQEELIQSLKEWQNTMTSAIKAINSEIKKLDIHMTNWQKKADGRLDKLLLLANAINDQCGTIDTKIGEMNNVEWPDLTDIPEEPHSEE